MASSSRIYSIALGSPTIVPDTTTILGSGSQGTPGAKRRLVHPDAVNFPPISYFSNPDRTFNLDNQVLPAPTITVVQTLSGTRVVRFDGLEEDVIITEIWTAQQNSVLSMPTFFFRQLYEYWINPPDFDPDPNLQEYIQWEPRDRTDKVYDVEITRLTVGGGAQNNQLFDVSDSLRTTSGSIAGPLDDLDASPTGVVDRTVLLQMRIVQEVVT